MKNVVLVKAKRKAISVVALSTLVLNMNLISPFLKEDEFKLQTEDTLMDTDVQKLRKKYLKEKQNLLNYQNGVHNMPKYKNNFKNQINSGQARKLVLNK